LDIACPVTTLTFDPLSRGGDGNADAAVEADAAFTDHGAALFRYLAQWTGDPDRAEDLVQETFVRFLEHPPNDPARVRAWLFRVGTNLARETTRRHRRQRTLLLEHPVDIPGPAPIDDPGRNAERTETRATVRAALDALHPRDRTILLMRESGFRHREIAEAVGTTTKAVGTLIARALDHLARRLDHPGRET